MTSVYLKFAEVVYTVLNPDELSPSMCSIVVVEEELMINQSKRRKADGNNKIEAV